MLTFISKYFKKCFKCNHNYPLFLFPINFRKYQLSTAKGKGLVCKICLYKEVINEGSYVKVTLNNKLDKEGKKLPDIIEVIRVEKTIINGLKRIIKL